MRSESHDKRSSHIGSVGFFRNQGVPFPLSLRDVYPPAPLRPGGSSADGTRLMAGPGARHGPSHVIGEQIVTCPAVSSLMMEHFRRLPGRVHNYNYYLIPAGGPFLARSGSPPEFVKRPGQKVLVTGMALSPLAAITCLNCRGTDTRVGTSSKNSGNGPSPIHPDRPTSYFV